MVMQNSTPDQTGRTRGRAGNSGPFMKGSVLPFAIFFLVGLVLSPAGFLHASLPADSLQYCLPFDCEQWQREHPRPAAKRLADLNTGEPRTVRLFYFLPNDRPFRPEVVQRIKDEIRNIQVWFGEQIQAHGFGYKTIRFETDDEGQPLVHRVDGQHPDSHYLDQTWELVPEIEQVFDLSKSVSVFVIDNSTNQIDRTAATGSATWSSKQSGALVVVADFSWQTLAHELGHTFGIGHDFRDDSYIMSYGGNDRSALSACSAGLLAFHPYFNPDVGVEWADAPAVELLSAPSYPEGTESVPIRLGLSDAHGLQQVRLKVPTRGRHPLGLFELQMKTCVGLGGEEETVVEIDYDGRVPSGRAYGHPDDLSDPKVHPISVTVIDRDGNRTGIRFNLWELSPQHLATLELAEEVRSVAFASGGTTLVSGSGAGVEIWDLETQTGTTTALSCGATAVALSPGGSTLASGSGSEILLLNMASRQVTATFSDHTHPISSLAFSPDGRFLASGGPDAVRLWDLETQAHSATLPVGATSVAFSPDRAILASGSGEGVQLWDLETKTDVATFRHSVDRWGPGVNTVAFSPDGTLVASGGDDTTVRLWNAATGEEVAILEGHDDPVKTVAFSTDGTLLASGAGQEGIILWDVLTEIEVVTLRGEEGGASTVAFSPDNLTLAAGWQDGGIGLWDISEWLSPRPRTLVKISGDDQRGPIETPLDRPLVVEVRDQYGNPLEGAQVTFSVIAGDGKLNKRFAVENATTGLDGRAESILTLGIHPGTNTVEASIPGLERVTFVAVGVGAPDSMDGDFRTWHLPEGATVRLGKGGIGGEDGAVAFSPDDQYLAVASGTGVWLYDLATYRPLALWPSGKVHSVVYSPDGKTLAAGMVNDSVELWDVETGYKTATLANPGAKTVSFSTDGKTLAAAAGRTVFLWDIGTETRARSFARHSDHVASVAVSPDGTTFATGSGDGSISLWDIAERTGTTLSGADIYFGLLRPVNSVAFSPDGTMLATGSTNRTINLWDVATGTNTATLTGHSAGVNSVAFSPDGRTLASGSRDGTVKLWDIATERNTSTLSGHAEGFGKGVVSVRFSFDGTMLASGSHDGSVRVWDVATGNAATLDGHFSRVESLAYSPDGAMLATGSGGGAIQLWDVAIGQRTATLSELDRVYSVAFSPDGTVLAGSGDRTIQLWDVPTRTSTGTLSGHSQLIRSVSFSPDGTMLASGSFDGTARLWNVATRTNTATLTGHSRGVLSVSFSSDGTVLASGLGDGKIQLWDVATETNTVTFPGHESTVFSVAFSPDGRMLASGSQDFTAKLWDVETGSNTAILGGHSFMVHSVAFSPDGRMLASASGDSDGMIKLWDVETGLSTATLAGHTGWVHSVAFSPDGRTLASGADDGTVLLWDTQLLQPRARTLTKLSGDKQQGSPGAQLTEPLVISVLDQYGDPFPGAEVTFAVTAGGGTLSETTGTTDANGRASTTLTMGSEPGRNTVVARVAELKPVIFSATEKGKPSTLTKVSGDGQQGPAGAPLAEPFVVSVLDQKGNPFAGAIVHFNVTRRGGSLSTAATATDTNGRAFTTLTLGNWPGVNSIDATVTGLDPVTFTATGLAVPKTLTKISGDEQTGVLGASLSEPFVVSVLDRNRAPVSGVPVTFAVISGEGTLSATTASTDENGRAASILTLGLRGANTVSVSVHGLDPVTFTATAEATPDFDGDGVTGFSDFFLLADAFGGSDPRFDLDGSGSVDFGDFFLLADYFAGPARGKLLALAREIIGLPDGPQLHQNAPNPFNSGTVISWFLLRPGPVRVEVFALTGQQVAVLHQGPKKAGVHRVRWDGRDDRGRPLASGVYLYRLVSEESIRTRKLTLLR